MMCFKQEKNIRQTAGGDQKLCLDGKLFGTKINLLDRRVV